ncbi:MAG: hypothetical protein KKF56_05405 [Nanoarchaeota archaeon]|nr:hypothetical protein [Nanoarchaeota archaeon]
MKNKKWLIALIILAIATIIDLFVVDPVPFVDEVLLIAGTIFVGYKTLIK